MTASPPSGAASEPAPELPVFRRILILVTVVLGSTLYATTLLIASTLLPKMQGTLSATSDEIAWVMTFNILATAVATPTTGWLTATFGRRRVVTTSILCFTAATFMCGAAQSLEALVAWRIVQGATGAPMVPLSQTILLDSFPPRQTNLVSSIFGMAVVIGPVIGPTLGGFLSETYGWRAAFYMIVPVGVIAFIGLRLTLPRDRPTGAARLDWIGFLALSATIGCLQLALSRGQRLDWLDSPEIVTELIGAGLAFYLFLAHSLTAERPFLNIGLLRDRNFALGLVLVTMYGMLNFTPMVLLPPLLQTYSGFPDPLIGEVIACRGLGATLGFFLAMFVGRLDPRIGMAGGFGLQAAAGLWLMHIDLNVDVPTLAVNSMMQGIAIGVIWVPLTLATFAALDRRYLAEATAVFHLLRNIGSSLFISVCVAEIVRITGLNYERMTELLIPYNKLLAMPDAMGAWTMGTPQGMMRLSREITRQSAMIGYIHAFGLYTLASAAALPLILLVARRRAAAPA